jgi:hypothetical protein
VIAAAILMGPALARPLEGGPPPRRSKELGLQYEGELSKAVLYLSAVAGLGNSAFRAHHLLARALLKFGPTAEADAVRQLQRALRMNPNYKAARNLLEKRLSENEDLRQWLSSMPPDSR